MSSSQVKIAKINEEIKETYVVAGERLEKKNERQSQGKNHLLNVQCATNLQVYQGSPDLLQLPP